MATPFKAYFCKSPARFTNLIPVRVVSLLSFPHPHSHPSSNFLSLQKNLFGILVTQYLNGCWDPWFMKKTGNYSVILSKVFWNFKDMMASGLQDRRNAFPGTCSLARCTETIWEMSNKWEDLQWEELFQVVSNWLIQVKFSVLLTST